MISNVSVCVVLGSVLVISAALKPNYFLDHSSFRYKRQAENSKCTLPPHPENGEWKLQKGNGQPGGQVPEATILKFDCKPGYKLSSNILLVCVGQWSSKVPKCEKLCPPLYPSDTYDLRCVDKIGKNVSCGEATQGTNLEYECRDFYETPIGLQRTAYCENGKWDSRPMCRPVCGKKKYFMYNSEKPDYPWVAAIYEKVNGSYENICEGSILSQTVVLTAAHCVTNSTGDVLPKENYLVGVGKLYRSYLAPGDTNAQYSELFEIAVPTHYKGIFWRYLADIAVLMMKEQFVLSKTIQPVCFKNVKNIDLYTGIIGEVAGWGLAEDDRPAEALKSLLIPYKYETVCADELPPEWADRYNLQDKICAGFVNKSTRVCKRDSGGGLAFKYHEDNRYYVHGVVSVGYKLEDTCDIQQNYIYTKVTSYYDFVNRFLTTYGPEVKDCVLPPFPKNGRWTTEAGDLKPGDAAPSDTVLKVECQENYQISSAETIECGTAHIMPRCNRLCPKVDFPVDATVVCGDRNWNLVDCSAAIEGTRMLYNCPRKYTTPDGSNYETRTCEEGSWGSPEPECIRILKDCGIKIDDSEMEYPWNVGIYKLTDTTEEKYKYVCGGSLVSQYAVLTGDLQSFTSNNALTDYNTHLWNAQCVTDEHGNVLPEENFVIAAGNFYGKYGDSRDTHTQIRNLSVTLIHPEYKISNKKLYDIALVIVTSPFRFNAFVQPVCLIDIDSFWKPATGEIVGWRFEEDVSPKQVEALEVKYSNYDSCKISSGFKSKSYIFDKKCVRFNNESVCLLPEDSGKGLVAKSPEDGRYYLRGIVKYYNSTECPRSFWNVDLFFYRKFIDSAGYIF